MNAIQSTPNLDALAARARRTRRKKSHHPVTAARIDAQTTETTAGARVLGPYRSGTKWRLVLLQGQARKALVADSYESAIALRGSLLSTLQEHASRSFSDALEEYLRTQLEHTIVPETADTIRRMLRRFLPLDKPITVITPERAQRMYLDETKRPKANGEPLANDSHHLLLRRIKHFYKWAVSCHYVERNPFAEVRPIGRPHRGKPQLRIDEARKLVLAAVEKAKTLDVGSTAALMQIFLGLRPTESVIRVVRDLDDGGGILWVPFGKTSNAKRRLKVPEPLRGILLQHAQGKPVDAPLLGPSGEPMHTRHALRHRLIRLCQETGVPVVCPHSLRGLNATLALEAGATSQQVAAALGHASFITTARHYVDASSVANLSLRRVADLLGTKSDKRPCVEQLATLLRDNLLPDELRQLREQLAR